MRLSSSDGTMLTIEQLSEVSGKLGDVLERITEINNGTYKKDQEAIQFDFVTCPNLSNEVDKISGLIDRIKSVVYQEK